MSRIGKKPIAIPEAVNINVDEGSNRISVKGPRGQLDYSFTQYVKVSVEGSELVVDRTGESREHRAMHGTTRALIANMIKGASDGFSRNLEISGTGYKAEIQGKKLILTVGYNKNKPAWVEIPTGVEVKVPSAQKIEVSGIDKQLVGQVAANIRRVRPPEPYNLKGIKYEGEVIKQKESKATVSGG
ncbi:MAG: 50S ribosomal protein L6 [Planctomycetes bacterium]|nr:50S ribosomal protein L6 [Planctomycetota bacterium]